MAREIRHHLEDSEASSVSVSRVAPGAEPESECARLLERSHNAQGPEAVVLDADEWALDGLVNWIQRFHESYLTRQIESSSGGWTNALLPTRTAPPVPPALVVAVSQGAVNGEQEARISAAGAVVLEKTPAPLFNNDLESVARWVRTELPDLNSYLPEPLAPALDQPGSGPSNFAAYVDPVYRLSEKDFEELLERGRTANPLEAGE